MIITFGKKMFGVLKYQDVLYVQDMDNNKSGKMRVKKCSSDIFRLDPSGSIYAMGGAKGLFRFMAENSSTEDLFSVRVKQICEFVLNH